MSVLLVLPRLASAEPWDDPLATLRADLARRDGWDLVLGNAELPWIEEARLLDRVGAGGLPAWADALAPERALLDAGRRWPLVVVARPGLALAEGDLDPVNQDGDPEPGWVTARASVDGAAYLGPLVAVVRPEVVLDGGPGLVPGADLGEAWVGVLTPGFGAGFGKRDRWLGPGRHAALLVSDHAEPPPLGWVAGDWRFGGWGDHFGRFRVEGAVGWMDRPRDDVDHPGLLRLDLRWRPCSAFELGLTRQSLFGGAGRPPVDLGQLLLPTEPHVYDDPDRELADQNELASLDFRVTLPLRRWFELPVDHVEGWWQYGGEDVVALEAAGIPYPSLAGVANLYGGEVKVGPLALTTEFARLMDDYFRWYTGHRVYHDGFTQEGASMGAFTGGDAELYWGAARWEADRWRARAWVERTRRVGVIEALNDRLFTLMTEERRVSVGVDAGLVVGSGWLTGGLAVGRVTGEGFVPGADGWEHRVHLAWSPAAPVSSGPFPAAGAR